MQIAREGMVDHAVPSACTSLGAYSEDVAPACYFFWMNRRRTK